MEHKGKYYILSEGKEHAHWIQNIMHNSVVSFSVGSDSFNGTARIIDPIKESKLAHRITELMTAKYKWNKGLIAELSPISIMESK